MSPLDLTKELKDAPAGEWIALSRENKIVGTGKTVEEAIRSAKGNGNSEPTVMKVPPWAR